VGHCREAIRGWNRGEGLNGGAGWWVAWAGHPGPKGQALRGLMCPGCITADSLALVIRGRIYYYVTSTVETIALSQGGLKLIAS